METDVLVIGGGATGAGIAWDLSLRGVRAMLVEMGDLATGTSGRYHGLLHSGGRYVVRDAESARECIEENLILRNILRYTLEDTGGLFVLCPGDDEAYADQWVEACKQVGIPTHEISPAKAVQREPVLNPGIIRAFEVPDGSCDSWDLVHAIQSASAQNGVRFLTYHRVDDFYCENGRVTGARVMNLRNNETMDITCAVAVIAAGPWSASLAAKAGVHFNMKLSRGAMLAFNLRWVNTVVNKLRKPGDGDIFVPVGTVSVTGTTSVPTDDPGDTRIEPWEIQRILSETEAMTPGISRARVLRAWAGVRPLYDPGEADVGRGAARTFAVLDHASHDGVEGLVTIVGGKLTTFRLMAEKVADVVCDKLNVQKPCITATTEVPSSHAGSKSTYHHLRSRLDALEHGRSPGSLICECEMVTAPQIEEALRGGDVVTLNDLRRDLRVGMGPCQGGFCAFRTAALRHELVGDSPANTDDLLTEFVERRFGGVKPLLWAHNLRQALLAEHIYQRILNLGKGKPVHHTPESSANNDIPRDGVGKRIVVVGAGLAGLMAALAAVESGAKVELVAHGQGALALHPGWIETGDVENLAARAGHPYASAAECLAAGLSLFDRVVGIRKAGKAALSAMGTWRPVAYEAGGSLPEISPASKVMIVGITGWRDFFAQLVVDNLQKAGYDAEKFMVGFSQSGSFDNWSVDIANLLDTAEGLKNFTARLKPGLVGANVVGLPAVLGFKPEVRQQLAEELGCPVFEIPTLPTSIPGMRLYLMLRRALLDQGVRFTLGSRVTELAIRDGRVAGVHGMTASGRPRLVHGDAVILCTGGLFGGGLESDYQGQIREVVAGLPVSGVPPQLDWFNVDFLSGLPQPIHQVGIMVDQSLRPLNADNQPFAPNLYAAGRLLAGYSPVAEGSTEGVDIATGVYAARQAVIELN